MDEACRDKHACTEMAREEQRMAWYGQFRESSRYDGKRAGECAECEDEEEREDVEGGVVVADGCVAAALGPLGGVIVLATG